LNHQLNQLFKGIRAKVANERLLKGNVQLEKSDLNNRSAQ